MPTKQLKKDLNNILNQLDQEDSNKQNLGYQALDLIKTILEETPFDVDTRVLRMRLNADIFENSSEIIQDATFIIENDQFKDDKIIGYNWLFWIYNSVLAMPEKAVETIEEQLVEIQTLIDEKFIRDMKEGELLDKLAVHYFENDDEEKALDLWYKSYKKYPYFERSGYVGMLLLDKGEFEKAEELLLTHYGWSYGYDDGFRLKYGIKLKELYDAKKLDNYPTLIGLLFNIIRNEKEYFKITKKLDFYEQYYPEIEKWAEKYPNNSFIWTTIAHTHYFDTKNYEKAFDAFKQLFECDKTIAFTTIKRVRKAAKKSKNDFFALPFKFEGQSDDMYAALTDLLYKGKKKKEKKKFAKLAVQYGEVGYKQYREYIINGKGDTHNNKPHTFAMLCNNYANALGDYADFFLKKKEKAKMYNLAGDIHMEGYKISPFIENLENASSKYFNAKNYKNTIKYSLQNLNDYKDELSVFDTQNHYWRIVRSYIRLADLQGAEKYYFEAKKLFNKVGKGSKDATYKFIFTAKLFFEFAIVKKEEFQKYIPEMEWFLANKVAQKQEPDEHGLVSYYLGICYKETKQNDQAKQAFQIAVDYLQDAEWGFYDEKCDLAEKYIKELGGKAIKKKRKKISTKTKSTPLKRLWRKITIPFMVFGIMGGIIWAAINGNIKEEKEKKG